MQAPSDVPTQPVARRPYLAPTLFALLAAAATAFLWTAPAVALDGTTSVVAWLRDRDDTAGRAIVTTVLATLALLGYVVAWGRATALHRPVRVGGERGTIPIAEFAAWIGDAVRTGADVRDAEVRVENRHRRGVRVALVLHVTPDARLQRATATAAASVEAVVCEQAGVRLDRPPTIEVRYEELILHARRPGSRPPGSSRGSHAA